MPLVFPVGHLTYLHSFKGLNKSKKSLTRLIQLVKCEFDS